MAHDGLWVLHRRAADLSAHPSLLHLSRCHLNLRRKRTVHSIVDVGWGPWGNTAVILHLRDGHAWGCARVLCQLAWDSALIVVSGRACRSCRCHCCCLLLLLLLLRGQVRILHARHVLLLGKVHLLMMLRMLRVRRAAMAIAL